MGKQSLIRVVCADDHPLIRDGIAFALSQERDMALVGEAQDGVEAVEAFRRWKPDIMLLDLQMPRMNGLEVLSALEGHLGRSKVIVLTTFSGDSQAEKALRRGAAGYLLKDALRTQLMDTIRSVHAGQKTIPPAIAMELAHHLHSQDLSQRELEVLRGAAAGCSNKMIADRLNLTEQTVKGYMKSVFAKLGANDRTHAVVTAMKRGILGPHTW